MPNLYGVANAPNYAVPYANLAGNIAVPANTNTPILTTPALVAPSAGWFYPVAWGDLAIANGVTPNTGMNIYMQIASGSWVVICSIGAYALVASQTNMMSFAGAGPASQVPWQGAGSTVSIGISGNQPFTVMQISPILVMLMRAPDQ